MATSASRNKLKWVLATFISIIRRKVLIIRSKWYSWTLTLSSPGSAQKSKRPSLLWEGVIRIDGWELYKEKQIITN